MKIIHKTVFSFIYYQYYTVTTESETDSKQESLQC